MTRCSNVYDACAGRDHNAHVKVRWAKECGVFQNGLAEYLSTKAMMQESSGGELIGRILDSYDLIAVTERLHESLVVLKYLLGLAFKDLLYFKASDLQFPQSTTLGIW